MIVRANHIGGYQFEMTSGENELLSDQWEDFGGEGAGPMPSELFLWSVAACFGQAIAYVAAKMRKEVPGLHLEVDGIKSKEVFRYGSVTVYVWADCDKDLLEKLIGLGKKYCFITNSLAEDVKLEFLVREPT